MKVKNPHEQSMEKQGIYTKNHIYKHIEGRMKRTLIIDLEEVCEVQLFEGKKPSFKFLQNMPSLLSVSNIQHLSPHYTIILSDKNTILPTERYKNIIRKLCFHQKGRVRVVFYSEHPLNSFSLCVLSKAMSKSLFQLLFLVIKIDCF